MSKKKEFHSIRNADNIRNCFLYIYIYFFFLPIWHQQTSWYVFIMYFTCLKMISKKSYPKKIFVSYIFLHLLFSCFFHIFQISDVFSCFLNIKSTWIISWCFISLEVLGIIFWTFFWSYSSKKKKLRLLFLNTISKKTAIFMG